MNKATLKQELKAMAEQTKKNRPMWKDLDRFASKPDYHVGEWSQKYKELVEKNPLPNAREVRHKHIAYCMLRGRKYEQIEQKTRPDNKADMAYVERLIEQYKDKEEQAS